MTPQPWFTWLQLTWVGLQLLGLAAVGGVQYARDPDTFRLLWADPMGRKMLLTGGAVLAGGIALLLAACVPLNRWAGRDPRRRLALYRGLMVGLGAFQFAAFYLPAVFALTVGPAAVAVPRELRGP